MGLLDSVTGSDAAGAARRGAKAIQKANKKNRRTFKRGFHLNKDLLEPRVEGETIAANRLLDVIQGNTSVRDDPVFQQDLEESIDSVNRSFAPTGKSLSGQRLLALRNADFGAEDRALNRLLTLSSPVNTNNLINLRNNKNANVASSRVAGANAFAAGEIGAANARNAGFSNLIGFGLEGARINAGLPS